MSERMKQQIREAADFLVRLLTVPPEPEPNQHYEQQTDEAEIDGRAQDVQQHYRP
jgi:hypothetical protein